MKKNLRVFKEVTWQKYSFKIAVFQILRIPWFENYLKDMFRKFSVQGILLDKLMF